MSYVEEFIENLTEEQLNKAEQKIKEKRYGKPSEEPTKAYPKGAYGADFIREVLRLLEKIGVDLTDEEKRKLKAMASKTKTTGEIFEGETFSVLPQGDGTVRLSRKMGEEDIETAVREFILGGTEHQRKSKGILAELEEE